jgi:Ca2+-binding RTX toxin-like protein
MAHQIIRNGGRTSAIVATEGEASPIIGTEGDDALIVTAPAPVDGLGGFDTLVLDFSTSEVGIYLDLTALWSGGVGLLNGYEIRNIEAIGYPVAGIENPWVSGSEHDDMLNVGTIAGQRTILAGLGGDDVLIGGDFDLGYPIHNYLNGGSGNDLVVGGAAADDVVGEDGDDRLYGGGGDDLLFGDEGRDLLHGGDGDDYLRGGPGQDQMFGDGGDDRLDGADGSDTLDGGAGSDSAEYYEAEGSVTIDLNAGIARESGGGFLDHLVSIENAVGSAFDDVLRGSSAANRLEGDSGDDRLSGGKGDDILWGGTGADTLEGGKGADLFVFREGDVGTDLISDFSRASGDRIDLSGIDADRGTSEDEAFSYVGAAAFSGIAGELRVVAGQGGWEVTGDWDGDAIADFTILVVSPAPPIAADFVL